MLARPLLTLLPPHYFPDARAHAAVDRHGAQTRFVLILLVILPTPTRLFAMPIDDAAARARSCEAELRGRL